MTWFYKVVTPTTESQKKKTQKKPTKALGIETIFLKVQIYGKNPSLVLKQNFI